MTNPSNPFDALTFDEVAAAARKRVSARAYVDKPADQEAIDQLTACADAINAACPSLDFQIMGPFDDAGRTVGINRKMFSGTFHWFAALMCPADDAGQELCGYYGEQLVLLASHLGLGTCWVAGTFDRDVTPVTPTDDRVLLAVVPLGYTPDKTPFAQRLIRTNIRRKTKAPEQIVESDLAFADLPEWVRAGAAAIIEAPSAVNQEPVVLSWKDDQLSARFDQVRGRLEPCDFGIAKLHFERLCGKAGTWEWGQQGRYLVEQGQD